MSGQELEPLPEDVARLVDLAVATGGPAPAARARMWQRVAAAVGPAAGAGPGGGSADGGAAAAGGPASVGGLGSATGQAAAAQPSLVAALLAKPLVVGLAAFTLGLGGGAGLYAGVQHARAPAPAVSRTALPAVAAAPAPAVAAPASLPADTVAGSAGAAPTVAATCPVPRAVKNGRGEGGRDADLAAERALVEAARTALDRRQIDGALALLDSHRREFPKGRLAEEREALAVQAWLGAARYDLVRARGAAFLARHPKSLFRPLVEAALRRAEDTDPLGHDQ